MEQSQLEDLTQLTQFCQSSGLMVRNDCTNFISLRLAYCPFVTSQQIYDQLSQVQKVWQKLIFLASKDSQLIIKTFQGVAQVDQMMNRVLKIYKKKLAQQRQRSCGSDTMIIFRGDFFLNQLEVFKLIQYNIVAVSMFSHSQNYQKVRQLLDVKKQLKFPQNIPRTQICEGIAKLYKQKQFQGIILIVVCYQQKNIVQQCHMMMEFLKYGIKSKRQPFCSLNKKLKTIDNKLYLGNQLVSMVYYRSGYMPCHFCENQCNEEECWKVKQILQLSDTIKIPNITMDLMNQKRMQTQLCKPEVYKKYLSEQQGKCLQTSIVKNWDFDNKQDNQKIIQMIKQKGCLNFVLKPNLQGGGNNLYGQNILKTLQSSSFQQRKKYILMQKIITKSRPNIFFKDNVYNKYNCHHQLSRLGVISQANGKVLQNTSNGYLVRAKPDNAQESRVMLGVGAFVLWAFQNKQN